VTRRNVRRLGRGRIETGGDQVLLDQRRVRPHCLLDIDDVRQHFIIDLDQREGLAGDGGAGRSNRGNRMPVIERFVAGHDVYEDIAELVVAIGKVVASYHSLHAG
jgi:hypothetical protein